MELLKKLYTIHSKSNKEDKMLEFLVEWLFKNLPEDTQVEMDKKCNLYVKKGVSETYPCVVAHVDQVQTLHSDDFEAVETNDIIFGWSRKNKRKEGLGADDKNGVWVALKCLLKYDAIKAAFFVGEEIGCIGSSAADMDFFKDCRFVLQCDRRGYNDLITEASCCELCSKDFVNAIHASWFGYSEAHGMMTDVMTLKENGLEVSCVNISCGYYEPHTDDEFTIKDDLLNCLYFVEHIIETCTDVYPHTYVYKPYSYPYAGYGSKSYYKGYGYGGYGGYGGYNEKKTIGFVSNGQAKTATQDTSKKDVEETSQVNNGGIQPFFDDESSVDANARTFEDDFNEYGDDQSWLNEIGKNTLNEEMRDELYDVIFALLSDCPNASCDMIYSALKNTYPTLSWDDARASYYEVKYDMKKCLSIY